MFVYIYAKQIKYSINTHIVKSISFVIDEQKKKLKHLTPTYSAGISRHQTVTGTLKLLPKFIQSNGKSLSKLGKYLNSFSSSF